MDLCKQTTVAKYVFTNDFLAKALKKNFNIYLLINIFCPFSLKVRRN